MFKRSAQSSLNYAHCTDTMHSGSNSRQNWSKKLQRGRHREKSGPRWSCEKRTPHTKPSSSSPFVITQPVHTALTYECITNNNDDPDGEEFDRPTTTATTTTVWTWTQTGIQIIFHVIKSWERVGWLFASSSRCLPACPFCDDSARGSLGVSTSSRAASATSRRRRQESLTYCKYFLMTIGIAPRGSSKTFFRRNLSPREPIAQLSRPSSSLFVELCEKP